MDRSRINRTYRVSQWLSATTVLAALLISVSSVAAEGPVFEVTLSEHVAAEPVTGRLYVFLSQHQRGEPMRGPHWYQPEPFFALDVDDVAPGESITVDESADAFPDVLANLRPGRYRAQAILDHDFYHQHHAKGVGNYYSDVVEFDVDPQQPGTLPLALTNVIEEKPFPESERVKQVVRKSRLLSEFHNREVLDYAGVVLPESYANQPNRRYPVVYIVTGFGGSHYSAERLARLYAGRGRTNRDGVEFIYVVLSGDCKWGHHVYADSATNGPRGAALVEELIPYVDATFRTIPAATARFVTGHSSGGWSSLWLQVTYPEVFGGVWSTSPDPVDFRDYQQVNLYADPPLSLYVAPSGARRPLARSGEEVLIWYDAFARIDDCLARGGQLRSFEAVFSPLGEDGLPLKLWDRATGRIDPAVARAWQKYDIGLKLERNWDTLQPLLAGKLHIVTGSLDTYYLEGAVEQLADSLQQLGSDAEITIIEGKGHSDVLTAELYATIRKQMTDAFLKYHGRAAARRTSRLKAAATAE